MQYPLITVVDYSFQLITVLSLVFIAYGLSIKFIDFSKVSLLAIIACGMGLRLLCFIPQIDLSHGVPLFLTDVPRYLWDGHVLASGINPYQFTPMEGALDNIAIPIREQVTWYQLPTIYPPLMQFLFAVNAKVLGGSLWGLRLLWMCFDLLGAGLLWKFFSAREGRVLKQVLFVYLFNPLLIYESYIGLHFDIVSGVLFLASVFYLIKKNSSLASALLLALACLAKLWPIVVFPLFILKSKNKVSYIVTFVLALLLAHLPFYQGLAKYWGTIQEFSGQWVWNSALFQWIMFATNVLVAKVVTTTIFLACSGWCFYSIFKGKSFLKMTLLVLTAFLFTSSVFHPHYALWVLPFAVLLSSRAWLVLSFLVVLSYAGYIYNGQYNLLNQVFLGIELFTFTYLFVREQKTIDKNALTFEATTGLADRGTK